MFLLISFTGRMTNFVFDGMTSSTPLAILKNGESFDLIRMFIGNTAGTIGETSTIALLIGAIYLIIKGVIKLTIPMTYIITFAIFTLLFSPCSFDSYYLACELCGGGLIFGAFFMATDYVTSPMDQKGQIIYGVLLGVLTGLFRFFGTSAEGVSYAIIISNLLVPLIDKLTLKGRCLSMKKIIKRYSYFMYYYGHMWWCFRLCLPNYSEPYCKTSSTKPTRSLFRSNERSNII